MDKPEKPAAKEIAAYLERLTANSSSSFEEDSFQKKDISPASLEEEAPLPPSVEPDFAPAADVPEPPPAGSEKASALPTPDLTAPAVQDSPRSYYRPPKFTPGQPRGETERSAKPPSRSWRLPFLSGKRANPARTGTRRMVSPLKPQPDGSSVKPSASLWNFAALISLLLNLVLIVAVIFLSRDLASFKNLVGDKLLGGLVENFASLDQAHLRVTVPLVQDVPLNLNIPIQQETVAILTQDTTINGAYISLKNSGVSIDSLADIILPAGTYLPVRLNLTVPLKTTVPINVQIPLDIPLNQTGLHQPLLAFQQSLNPLQRSLLPQTGSSSAPAPCPTFQFLCSLFFPQDSNNAEQP